MAVQKKNESAGAWNVKSAAKCMQRLLIIVDGGRKNIPHSGDSSWNNKQQEYQFQGLSSRRGSLAALFVLQ